MIIQGTTPTHTFELPFDAELLSTARFVYSQEGEVKVVKCDEDVILEGDKVSTTLTQEDTFSFDCDTPVMLLLRVMTKYGEVMVIDSAVLLHCCGCPDKEVLA